MDATPSDPFSLFESVFTAIPPAYRQVDASDLPKAPAKQAKAAKSLMDIHQHAANKIKAEQQQNREKSVAKIKQLTEQHKKSKLTEEEVKARAEEDLSSDEGVNAQEAGKQPRSANKKASKNAVAQSKAENKRAQKEAIKRNKQKRGKGTHVEKQQQAPAGQSDASDAEME